MNPAYQIQAKSFEERLKPGTSHRDAYSNVILGASGFRNRLDDARAKVSRDPNLSDVGRQDALAKAAKGMTKDLLELSRLARVGRKHVEAKKASFTVEPKPLDPTDSVAELRRQEVRAFVRSAAERDRLGLALSMMADQAAAEAIMATPIPAMVGLSPQVFERLKQDYLSSEKTRRYGSAIKEIDDLSDDLDNVEVAVRLARTDLQKATGLTDKDFDSFIQPMQAEIDAR